MTSSDLRDTADLAVRREQLLLRSAQLREQLTTRSTVLRPAFSAADRVHADWQRRPGCGEHAMCDQINSETGVTCGSRYYPRGVTTILWLRE